MKTWSLELNENNIFDLKIENKKGLTEDVEISFVKHNLFCKGRISKLIENNNLNRFGSITNAINNTSNYSSVYQFYENQNNNPENLEYIKKIFNLACQRDYKKDFFEQKIIMTKAEYKEKNEIVCYIQIGDTQKIIKISQ